MEESLEHFQLVSILVMDRTQRPYFQYTYIPYMESILPSLANIQITCLERMTLHYATASYWIYSNIYERPMLIYILCGCCGAFLEY
jgi:hypothetical protein